MRHTDHRCHKCGGWLNEDRGCDDCDSHGSLHPAGSATATGFKELFSEARKSIHYWIEGCFLAETPEQEKAAEAELLKFINENYTAKSPNVRLTDAGH